MKTYQDLIEVGEDEQKRANFVLSAISEHKESYQYITAKTAKAYAEGYNPVISQYQKILYTISGQAVPDNYTANHKCKSGFFKRFVTQRASFLLGNGVSFENREQVSEKLGGTFDQDLYFAVKNALIQSCSFGFYNLDRVIFFDYLEFVPLWDEEDGALKAGIRFWQIADGKPLRATLFEIDGYTEYIRKKGENFKIMVEKRPYIIDKQVSEIEEHIYDGENYETFPIVPLWGNAEKQSTITGIKEQIDCYDLIKSGFANDLDDASMIYWTLENAGGMDDVDLAKFVERMRSLKASVLDQNGVTAQAHTLEIPYQSRETYLERLKKDLYEDYMALDVEKVSAGSVTATQINAAYEPINEVCDELEYCILDFLHAIMKLAEIEDNPTFKRSIIRNTEEETKIVLMASAYLDDETILRHLPFLSPDEIEGILSRLDAEEMATKLEKPEEKEEENAEESTEEKEDEENAEEQNS